MTTKNEQSILPNLKKWLWSSFLLQAVITIGAFLIAYGTIVQQLKTHDEDIKILKSDMKSKADIQTMLDMKNDINKNQDKIMDDVQYIRQRIDEHMSHPNSNITSKWKP